MSIAEPAVTLLLEGKRVDLRVMEREDLPLYHKWANDPEFYGQYDALIQASQGEVEKTLDYPQETRRFIVQKKDGTKIGLVMWFYGRSMGYGARYPEVGYVLLPGERGKGYGTEALNLIVDFLFLSKDAKRVEAMTDTRNIASQRILEKGGFKREGTLRMAHFARGEWRDAHVYGLLRDEWKGPRMLKA